jgi:hypothetical protein
MSIPTALVTPATPTMGDHKGRTRTFLLYAGPPLAPLIAPFGHTSRLGACLAPGAIRNTAVSRRSRSESDVPSAVVANGEHICTECGQSFVAADRLAKHIASRHRFRCGGQCVRLCIHSCRRSSSAMSAAHRQPGAPQRTNSMDGQILGARAHRCTMCHKSFGRSDMLTR